jgi:predicted lipid-binding transport protein (Tim44 family)
LYGTVAPVSALRERLEKLIGRWHDKENNVFDTLTLKDCINELAAALKETQE